MVQYDTGGGRFTEDEVRRWKHGEYARVECELILEVWGAEKWLVRRFIEYNKKLNVKSVDYGLPHEVRFKKDRVGFEQLKHALNEVRMEYANEISDEYIEGIDDLIEKDPMAYTEAEREIQFFVKAHENPEETMDMRPKPKVAFELQYILDEGIDLEQVVEDIRDAEKERAMPSIGEIKVVESESGIIVIPLRTIFDPLTYMTTFFDLGGMASNIMESMTGRRAPSYRLNQAVLTCTHVG